MIQFALLVVLEVTLASYGMLEDVLQEADFGQSAVPRLRRVGQSPFSSRCGSTVPKNAASSLSNSWSTIPELSEQQMADVGSAGDFREYETLGSFEPVGSPQQICQVNQQCLKIY